MLKCNIQKNTIEICKLFYLVIIVRQKRFSPIASTYLGHKIQQNQHILSRMKVAITVLALAGTSLGQVALWGQVLTLLDALYKGSWGFVNRHI